MAKRLPPLMIVCGSSHFQCRRAVANTLKQAKQMGYAVQQAEIATLAESLTGLMVLFGGDQPLLFWVKASGKIDADMIAAQAKADESAPRLLLWHEGEPDARTSFAKNLDKLPKGTVKHYTAPSDFKAEGEAAIFLSNEMKNYGYTLEASLAQAMVARAGTDFGVLSFEAMKLNALLKANNAEAITPQLVGQALASLGDTTALQFIDALRTRNPKQVAFILARIRRMAPNGSGAVKEMVGRTLTTLMLVLQAADFYERGKDSKEAAVIVGQNPWYYDNKIVPFAKTWGRKRLAELVKHFCTCDRSVLFGVVDPWISFEIGILRIVAS